MKRFRNTATTRSSCLTNCQKLKEEKYDSSTFMEATLALALEPLRIRGDFTRRAEWNRDDFLSHSLVYFAKSLNFKKQKRVFLNFKIHDQFFIFGH